MRRDEIILRTAEDLFYERGFAAVGVAEIGKRAGISGPGIYKHFSSKDEIVATLLERAAMELLVRLQAPRDDPWEELRNVVETHARFVLDHPKLSTIWVREVRVLGGEQQRRMARRDAAYTDRLTSVMRRCFPQRTDEELVAATWMLIYQLSSVGMWPAPARRVPNLAELMTDIALQGLASLKEARPRVAGPAA